jgi:hypothetical protein
MIDMKKPILTLFILFAFAGSGWAETYFLRADGSGSKVDATGSGTGACGAAGTAMSIATHDGETYAAGDTIYLCDDGGTYRDQLDVPSSGSNGSPITYTEASGDTPIISGADLVTTWTGYVSYGSDLLTDGDMEADDAAWVAYGTPTTDERSTGEQVYEGTYSRKYVGDGHADGMNQQNIVTTESAKYSNNGQQYIQSTRLALYKCFNSN